jgi:hypothetical protein
MMNSPLFLDAPEGTGGQDPRVNHIKKSTGNIDDEPTMPL